MSEPQVSWKAIERNAAVVSSDGAEIARVVEVAGDPRADIFNALVVKIGPLEHKLNLPAERVVAIWPRRIEVDLTAREVARLPVYQESVVEKLPKESFFRRLFGPRT
ncbi:MAG TPA: hypothetical protein VD769_13975 [Gaiellaceae bacterium]|nr:hypothetical protein [Gaiellaceae bacterium]